MSCVELFNRTCYPDDVLLDALKYAKRKMNVKGDVAVKVTYLDKKGYYGQAWGTFPHFSFLAGKAHKKYADKKYFAHDYSQRQKSPSATKEGAIGYIEICVHRPIKTQNYTIDDALDLIETMLHEMGHVWQYRNKKEVLENSTCETWKEFRGFASQNSKKRTKHSPRPIEKHVLLLLDDAEPTSYLDKKRREGIVNNISQMYEDVVS